jgi:hypothetical protein
MALKTIKAILRLRGGTLSQWRNNNTVLLDRQIGMVTSGPDYGKFKVGDGTSGWNDLPYILGADGIAATIDIAGTDTVDYNIPANVVNEGTSGAARLRFTIPRGYPGTTVPDITGLAEIDDIAGDDELYVYDTSAGALKKATVTNLLKYTQPPGQLRYAAYSDPAKLAADRLLPLDGAIIPIMADYQALGDKIYVGDANNASAEAYYKCDEDGTRNIAGLYMKLTDYRGIGVVGAGSQTRHIEWTDTDGNAHADDTLYDGKEIGEFTPDRIRNIPGTITADVRYDGQVSFNGDGAFRQSPQYTTNRGNGSSAMDTCRNLIFDPSLVVPTGPYNQGPVVAAYACITF